MQQIKAPLEYQEYHLEIIENFTKMTINQINDQIEDIAQEHEVYKAELVEIMKILKPSAKTAYATQIIPEKTLDQQLNGFDEDFQLHKNFLMAKEALCKKNILGAGQLIKKLMEEIVGQNLLERKFCEMYSLIIKALPEFDITLSDDQVLTTFAPLQLKNTVSQLFQQLKKQVNIASQMKAQEEKNEGGTMSFVQLGEKLYNRIPEQLQEIFFQEARFYEMMIWYLTEQTNYIQIVSPYLKQIKSQKELQLEHLTQAFSQIDSKGIVSQRIAQFMNVDIDLDLLVLQVDISRWYLEKQKLNGQMMILVLYDLIKKRCTFEKFIALLSQDNMGGSVEMLFTQQFFISFLLNNSDTYLRTMILLACSFYMPLPLVSYQPKYLKTETENDAQSIQIGTEFIPSVYEELFFCFEKHMAVITFKLSANPNKSPQGCTSLTNYVFNRSFQTHQKSFVNYGSIEIQFDYNFEHPMFVPVADAHGLVEENILERVYPMFDIFLIHSFSGKEHEDLVKKHVAKINKIKKNTLIFLIIHDEAKKDNNFTTSQDGKIFKIMLSSYNDLLGIPKANLRSIIINHFLKHIGESKDYESNIPARLNSLQQFSEFAIDFQANVMTQFKEPEIDKQDETAVQDASQLPEALSISRNFLKMIELNKKRLRSDKVLTMNVLFEEACKLEKIMLRDTALKSDICEQHRLRVEELYIDMKHAMPSTLTNELRKIIDHQNYLGLTSIISKLIRSFLNQNLQPLLKQREELRTQVQMPKIEKDKKDEMFTKIKEITNTLEKSWYSNEFLYREFYISEFSKMRGSDKIPAQPFPDYLSLAILQISQGQPFEIIDGNNLQFIKEVYQRIEADSMQKEQILVVSVIGPQSSGKSLLLNTLFGAQFLSSAGRCTRGIYGCLIDIKCGIKKTHFKKILILDSEGIQSTEALDEAFDKRVVFYILCMSHVVLICNKGEMNKNMEDTIKLASDCIMQVRENIDQQPQVNIIMNNVQINENTLFQTIQNLSNSIMEMNSSEKLRQIFKIDQSNVFLLPNAFAQSGNEEFVAYQPSYQFALKVDQLRTRILTFMQTSNEDETASYTLESWFKKAQKFWEFTDGYAGLTEYSTLEERKQDILLCEFIKKLIAKNFEDHEMVQKYEKMIHNGVTQVLNQHQGFDQTNINVIKQKIDDTLYTKIQEVQTRIEEEFRKFIDDNRIHPEIKKRRFEQLDTQIRQHKFNWQQLVQKLIGEFNQNKSKFIGDKSLQNAIEGYIQDNHAQYNEQKAEIIFKQEWEKIIKEMKNQLKQIEEISKEQFDDIGQLYRAFRRSTLINIDKDRQLIQDYQDLNSNSLLNHLHSQKQFFFFDSQSIKPSQEKFQQQIANQKNYLLNGNEFFHEINRQNYYDWQRVIQERFNFEELDKTLREIGQRPLQKDTTSKGNKIIEKITEEAAYFNIEITDEFENNILNLEKTVIQPYIDEKIREKHQQVADENSYVQQAIKENVAFIRENLSFYFKYRINNLKRACPEQMQFFSNKFASDYRTSTFFIVNPKIQQENVQFYQYLKYLIHSEISHINLGKEVIENANQSFYNLIDYKKILKCIQTIVLDNILKENKQYSTIEELIQELIHAEDLNITQKFYAMDFKPIQMIAVRVEGIISKINEDMEPYNFKVSEHGTQCLHQIAQTYIIRVMQEVARLTEHAPLYTFIKTKEVQRGLFVAKLTSNDKEMDIKLAERTGKHLTSIIINHFKQQEIKAFQDKIAGEQNLFKLKTIIKNIEDQVIQIAKGSLPNPFIIEKQASGSFLDSIKAAFKRIFSREKMEEKKVDFHFQYSPDEVIEFYAQPGGFLKKKFDDLWSQVTNIEIKKAQQSFANGIKQINHDFQLYFKNFQRHIINKKIQLSTNAFIPEDQDQLHQDFKVQCQKAMGIYFGLVVTKKWKAGTVISVDDHVKMIVPGNLSLVTSDDIRNELPQAYAELLQESIQNERISNIDNFIKKLMDEIQISLEIENQDASSVGIQENELIGNLQQSMKTKTLGCDQMCPLCRRQCDQNHEGDVLADRIHCCEDGHQIQGFGGNRHKLNNKAITYGCHELVDNDMVFWQGKDIPWEKFQAVIYKDLKWDLQDKKKEGAKQKIKEENIMRWNLIGPFICEYYRQKQNIEIKFMKADNNSKRMGSVQSTLYVLMLDKSSSMNEEDSLNGQSKWSNLKSAISQFIANIEKDTLLKENSKVSIITYNKNANLEIDALPPSQSIVSSLKNPDGGTDFNPPLILAKDQIEKHQDTFDSFVLVMMSDGESLYPQYGVECIQKSSARSKIKFKSIGYGGGSKSLTYMAEQLGGDSDDILEPNQLSNAFIQMIPNIYAQ